MGRRREFDEKTVVAAAYQAFWRGGFSATSTRDIEGETGLSTASLYNAFGDKRTLFRLGLEAYMEVHVRSRIRELGQRPPLARIAAFVDCTISDLADPGGVAGCLIVNSAMELPSEEGELRLYVEACLGEVESFIRDALEDATVEEGFCPDLPIPEIARGFMTMLMGLHVQAKSRPGLASLQSAARPMLSMLHGRERRDDPPACSSRS